jgi:hypothetical protein
MSGYLQRLASSARNPGGGIHPLVGSLYSAPLAQPPGEPQPAERAYALPIEEPAGKSASAAAPYLFLEQPAERSRTLSSRPQPSGSGAPPLAQPRLSAGSLEPTVNARQSNSAATAGNQRGPKPDIQRRPTASAEPDEIHIHIGRIEVTAVPQSVPRPAAPQPRKSVNLAEYLKRRRGGTS